METQFSDGKIITPYNACAYAEGFCEGENASFEDQLRAWAYLINNGMAWSLQGWYGRNAARMIEDGIISKEGVIDWDAVAELDMFN